MADTKISALTAVTTPAGTDEFAVNQGGTSKKMTLAQIRTSLPTVPSVISVGSSFSSTGVPTATLPGTHALNDILILAIQSSNDSIVAAPSGYTRLGPSNGIGAAAAAGTTKLSLFWKRDGGSESAPTLTDTGDHTFGVMLAIRGCPTTGDPFHLMGQNFKFVASTAGTASKGATVIDNSLVVSIFAHGYDAAAANASGPTNATLTSVTEQFDNGTADGTGGGILVISGVKAVHGSFDATTTTWTNSTVDVSTTIVFLPADAKATDNHPPEVQTFIGSPTDLDDTWVKADGARKVFAQIMGGGGSGSAGRNAATAEGGGGGGGGGYDEKWFEASDLAATVTVHAGKGGAATANTDGTAGNAGVVSSFGIGLTPVPLTQIAGTAATGAISADGGNGGCGGGRGIASPAVATARIALEAATAGAALGGVGGRGGSGTTANVGGSPAEWGGGGGESGADSDAGLTSANNGWSLRGGGGGAGGKSSGTASGAGNGGGANAPAATAGSTGADSAVLPYGGSGGGGGNSTTAAGVGGFPGGGGGGGGTGSGTQRGERGGHGCILVTTIF